MARSPHASPPLAENRREFEPATESNAVYRAAMYVPNRFFDLLDIFRVRARFGPGLAAGVRATKYAQVYLGAYGGFFAGLPGPREEPTIPVPVGFETLNGARLSVLDATATTCYDPLYSDSEFGIGAHLVILGLDLGIDPVEIADFFVGFAGDDMRNDDL